MTAAKKEGAEIWHTLAGAVDLVPATVGAGVQGELDWERRYQLMRTHTAMHILCGVVWRDYGAQVTGGNMDPGQGRMDFEFASLSRDLISEIEARCNAEMAAARDVRTQILPREVAFQIPDLIRTKINLLPAGITEVRTVEIVGLDLQADGGTHVANTRGRRDQGGGLQEQRRDQQTDLHRAWLNQESASVQSILGQVTYGTKQFKDVKPSVSYPEMEEQILKLWRERNVFQRSMSEREGGPEYVFYEGPPTANGRPGIHHVLARAFKDIFPRYKTMQGYYVQRRGGWDTHGLPVEIEVEKRLGLSGKKQIEEYGIAEFNRLCRQSTMDYIEEWERLTERMAFWVDLKTAYVTFHNEYVESLWWILKQFWDKGLLFQGYKIVPYCPRCGTPLSSHELSLGYKEGTIDPSVL